MHKVLQTYTYQLGTTPQFGVFALAVICHFEICLHIHATILRLLPLLVKFSFR